MKPGKFTHTIAVILSSISSLFAHGTSEKAEPPKTKFSKKSQRSADDRVLDVTSIAFSPGQLLSAARPERGQRYPWKSNIVTTVFWIGEQPSGNNPVPNRTSSWDKNWTRNYGGICGTAASRRKEFVAGKISPPPKKFFFALAH